MSTLNTKDLTGKVVVITGAGSGIGRALAVSCARRGARLALCDVNLPAVEDTAKQARVLGSEVLTAKVDVAEAADMSAFAEQVHAAFGPADLLVNNAGVAVIGGFFETEVKDWDWLIGINVMGVVHGCDAFVPAMVERGHGHVVNLSSAAGLLANPELTAYSATKYAVRGLSEGLRMELQPHGVGVTAICPGIINTAITANSRYRGDGVEGRRSNLISTYAKRGYTPERVATNILRAVDRDRLIAPIAAEAHVLYALNRFAPGLARWVSMKVASIAR